MARYIWSKLFIWIDPSFGITELESPSTNGYIKIQKIARTGKAFPKATKSFCQDNEEILIK